MQERQSPGWLAAALTAPGGRPDELMYEPIRSCPVTDPFGTRLLAYARR